MKILLFFTFVAVATVTGIYSVSAYTIPENNSKIEYLYVTGPEGDPLRGAEDHKQVLHIDVPESEQGEVKIGIFDPDTGGKVDARPSSDNPWNTKTEITVSGGDGEIYNEVFKGGKYDNKFYYFDSLAVTDGEKIGSFYRFTVVLTATTGDDANLFKVDVSPNSAKVSSPNVTFRLLPEEGSKMSFYPLVPSGTDKIIVQNYDLDHEGGTSSLHDPENEEEYEIHDSESGRWHATEVALSSSKGRFLDYVITKGTQYEAHAGLRITDADGNPIPIYFRKQDMGGCSEFTFDATSSFDPDNQALTYRWDFGDGNVSEEAIVTHRYESGGDYNVILSVQDSSGLHCDTAVTSQVVTVNTPPVADLTGPNTACTGQSVTFDASGSADSEQSQITYQWDFGDGTSAEGAEATKTFEQGGRYNVLLTVNDMANTTCSTDTIGKTIDINTRPIANAGDDVDLCLQHNQDYNVSFNGSGTVDEDSDSLTYRWDFGDGSGDDGVNVTHVYQNKGAYVATLFVDDASGSACSSSSDTVNINLNKAPVAVAGDDVRVCQGTPVTFDGSGSIGEEGEELQYDWDFGDGTTLSGVNVTHAYEQGGNYKAVLTVNDGQNTNCSTSVDSVFVTVNSMPTAVLNADNVAITGDEIDFDASGSNDPDGDGLTYTWDFGDGSDVQGGTNVTHAYNQGGNYSVRVTVDDNKGTDCSSDTTTIYVSVNTPPSAVLTAVRTACTGDEVTLDASGSNDPDGDDLIYSWDFGDGTSEQSGSVVTHVYNQGGSYTARVSVDDNRGTNRSTDVATTNVTINTPPSAVMSADRIACIGDQVSFDTSGTNDPDGDDLTYAWDFGDGTSGQGANVTHAYGLGGNYSVRLTVDDNKGTLCSVDLAGTNVKINTPPVADAGPNHVCCLETVSEFDGSKSFDADGDNLTYTWDFGDGNTGEGAQVTHVYTTIGRFVVTLTVNDNSGTRCDTATDSFTAVVNATPTSVIKIR